MAPRVLTNEEAGFSEEQLKKIATATEYKDKGDAAFKTGDAKTALQHYHFAIMYVKGIDKNPSAAMASGSGSGAPANDDKPITEVDVMQEKIYGNMSACHLKLQNWQRAVETADSCLKKNGDNLKALFRKGKALGEQGYWEKAEPILQDLLKRNPAEAPSINAEMARLQAIDKELQKKANKRLKGWMKRDKGDPEDTPAAAATETKAKDETSPAGPAPVSSATIEEVP